MTNSLPWKDPPSLRTVNHLFLWAIYTMAMLVTTRGCGKCIWEIYGDYELWMNYRKLWRNIFNGHFGNLNWRYLSYIRPM